LGVLAVIAIGTIAIAGFAFEIVTERTRTDFAEGLRATLNLRRDQIVALLGERFGDAELVSTRLSVQQLLDPATAPEARAQALTLTRNTLAEVRRIYRYDGVYLFNSAAQPILASDERTLEPIERDAIATALRDGRPTLVDIHPEGPNRQTYGVVQPVFAGTGAQSRLVGAVFLEIDAQGPVRALIEPWVGARRSMQLMLVRRSGDDVQLLRLERDGEAWRWDTLVRPLASPDLAGAIAMRTPDQRLIEAKDYRGVAVLAVATPVPGTPWVLMAKIDRAEVDAPTISLAWTLGLVVAFMLLSLMLVASIMWRRGKDAHARQQAILAQRYATTIAVLKDGFIRMDDGGMIEDVNAALCDMTGYARAELLGQGLAFLDLAGDTVSADSPYRDARFRAQWRRKSGEEIEIAGSATFVYEGALTFRCLIVRDVTERLAEERVMRRVSALRRLLVHAYMAMRAHDTPREMLRATCEDFVVDDQIVLVWAGWVEAGKVVPIGTSGPAGDYVTTLDITIDAALPTSHGPTGTCVREGRVTTTAAMQRDPKTRPWHAPAARWGLKSSAALPIIIGGRTIAAITVYSDREAFFDAEEVKLLQEMSEALSVAVEATERQAEAARLEAAVAESETRLRRLMQATPLAMHVFSARDRSMHGTNDSFTRLFGFAGDDFPTVDAWLEATCVDPVALARYREAREAAVIEARANSTTVTLPELALRCKDGTIRIVQAYLSMAGDEVIKSWVDLTDTRAQEAALRRREDIYAAVVAQAQDSIAVIDIATLAFVEFNDAAHRSLGYAREAFAALRLPQVNPHFTEAALAEGIGRAPQTGSGSFETQHRHRDGTLRDVRVSFQPIKVDGRDCIAAIWADITEERVRQRALSAEGEKHGALFDHSPTGIVLLNEDTTVVDVNPTLLRMLGATREQVIGTPAGQWMVDQDQMVAWRDGRYWREHLGTGVTQGRRLDGSAFDVEMSWSKVELGGQTFYYANLVDISERLRTEKELLRTERMSAIGQLTGGIAHDFNNLLMVISLNLEVAVDVLGEENRLTKGLKTALAAAYRGGELNSQLLTFAGRQSLRPVAVDIDEFLVPLQAMATRAVGERHTVDYVRHGPLPACLVDQAKLESAILNLVINARDALPDGGPITIETAPVRVDAAMAARVRGLHAGDYVTIAVRDAGIGMTDAVREHAFEPFFSTKGLGKGTGLGLSMVMGFVTQSGGAIDLQTAPGKGTRITLYLPVAAGEEMPAAAPAGAEDWRPGKLRILVVEDQADVRETMALLCREVGLEVVAEGSGEAALTRLGKDAAIDLLFTDIVMPGALNGTELARQARQARPGLKVLFTSGFSAPSLVPEDSAGTAFLAKPFRTPEFLAALRQLFGQVEAEPVAAQ